MNDVEKRFDTSNYQTEIALLVGQTKKVIGLMKDKLGEKIRTGPKTFSYLKDDVSGDKKAQGAKKHIIK